MRRSLPSFAVGMVLIYVALAIGAAGCLDLRAEKSNQAHHDGQHHASHSSFCAWACQVNPTAAVLAVAPLATIFAPTAILWPISAARPLVLFSSVHRSRAPPR
jgi:hypothetical protein